MNYLFYPLLLAIPCFLPVVWRLSSRPSAEPAGLLSDLAMGGIVFLLVWMLPRWLRFAPLLCWALLQITSLELLAAVQRLPSWQDARYLFDPTFIEGTTAGLHLTAPGFELALLVSLLPAALLPGRRPGVRTLTGCLAVTVLLLTLQYGAGRAAVDRDISTRYNPLHWLLVDALFRSWTATSEQPVASDLPAGLRTLDLEGRPLPLGNRVQNVLIITLEGISGIYFPALRRKMMVPDSGFTMEGLAGALDEAMLVPDFVAHSHQTIRGLYALHCGDFSKLSYETPKAVEVQVNPERAGQCLPAQLAAHGWETHFLQGAPLQFMNKDQAMPAMGFQQVHGLEWFDETGRTEFIWGTSDAEFFRGARHYLDTLTGRQKPWLLSLLTVATHQPFDATEEAVHRYGSRKIASVAQLDEAVSGFIRDLHRDGILDDTLVIITSDESHGAPGPAWFGSWGFAAVLAPPGNRLPHFKEGTYGLVDIEASILDYLDLPMPPAIVGRSLFRDYASGRDMVAYTGGTLRWQTADGQLFECGGDGSCRTARGAGILGPRPAGFEPVEADKGRHLFALAALLDHNLDLDTPRKVIRFAHGEVRQLPEKIRNEWTDNLIGAQYLDFPKDSTVAVDIRLKAVTAPPEGIQLKLTLRQFEQEVTDIARPAIPRLYAGQEWRVRFEFANEEARQAFSFHLVGEGKDASVRFDTFDITVDRDRG